MDDPLHEMCAKIFDSDLLPVIYESLSIFQLQLYTPVVETPTNILKEVNYLDARIKEIFCSPLNNANGNFFTYFKDLAEWNDPGILTFKVSEIKDHLTAMSLTYKSIHDYLELIFLHTDLGIDLTASKYLHARDSKLGLKDANTSSESDNEDLLPQTNRKTYLARVRQKLKVLRLYLDGDGVDKSPIYNQGAYYYYKNMTRPVNPLHIRITNYLKYKFGSWDELRRHRFT